jgi:hypothetical protein
MSLVFSVPAGDAVCIPAPKHYLSYCKASWILHSISGHSADSYLSRPRPYLSTTYPGLQAAYDGTVSIHHQGSEPPVGLAKFPTSTTSDRLECSTGSSIPLTSFGVSPCPSETRRSNSTTSLLRERHSGPASKVYRSGRPNPQRRLCSHAINLRRPINPSTFRILFQSWHRCANPPRIRVRTAAPHRNVVRPVRAHRLGIPSSIHAATEQRQSTTGTTPSVLFRGRRGDRGRRRRRNYKRKLLCR